MARTRGKRRTMVGVVVSDKMDKTIVVKVERIKIHPLYKKAVRCSKKYKVHDENNEAREGDKVLIMETRPLSKTKRFRLVRILERAGKPYEVEEIEEPVEEKEIIEEIKGAKEEAEKQEEKKEEEVVEGDKAGDEAEGS